MGKIKKFTLAVSLAVACSAVIASAAFATTYSPGGTDATSSSSNSKLTVGTSTISCTGSTINDTTPTGTAATLTGNITLAYTGCTASFGTAVTVIVSCTSGSLTKTAKWVSATDIATWVTIPSTCKITINITSIGCTLVVNNAGGTVQIGNGTSGAGGQTWTNGSSTSYSTDVINSDAVPFTRTAGGFLCPASGTGTETGTYTVISPTPAPGVTIGS